MSLVEKAEKLKVIREKTDQLKERWAKLPEKYRATEWAKNEYNAELLRIDPEHPESAAVVYWDEQLRLVGPRMEKRREEYRTKKEQIRLKEEKIERTKLQDAQNLIALQEEHPRLQEKIRLLRQQGIIWAALTLTLMAILLMQLID